MLKVWAIILKGKNVLKCRKCDIVFPQETHQPEQESQKKFFYNTGSSQSRGLITLVHQNLHFKSITEKHDKEGRIIAILAVTGETTHFGQCMCSK